MRVKSIIACNNIIEIRYCYYFTIQLKNGKKKITKQRTLLIIFFEIFLNIGPKCVNLFSLLAQDIRVWWSTWHITLCSYVDLRRVQFTSAPLLSTQTVFFSFPQKDWTLILRPTNPVIQTNTGLGPRQPDIYSAGNEEPCWTGGSNSGQTI